jgi:hypothetical protein
MVLCQQSDIAIEIHHRYCQSSPRSGAGKRQKKIFDLKLRTGDQFVPRHWPLVLRLLFSYAAKTGTEE